MTILLLFEYHKKERRQGYGITQFNKYFRYFLKRVQLVMHLEHKAGDKLYIDFAGNRLSILDVDDGEIREIEVFVVVLGCSQLTYVEAVYSKKNEDMVRACENALHYYGGVPTAIVADKLRSAVSKSSRYEPVINETFADFAEHYSTVVLPARAYRPKDKALVEAMVKIIYRSIYTLVNSQVYTSLTALDIAIKEA